jgi:hypothetical protein
VLDSNWRAFLGQLDDLEAPERDLLRKHLADHLGLPHDHSRPFLIDGFGGPRI